MSDNTETELDVTELLCPLPVLRARKQLEGMVSGAVLKVVATDPMSAIDMPHFCAQQGHVLLSYQALDNRHIFRIRCK
jgi:tRNA 2-thiouridine synthesizing protein A